MERLYLLVIWDNVDPQVCGPFSTEEKRMERAREIRAADEDEDHGIFTMNVQGDGEIEIGLGVFLGGDLDKIDLEESAPGHVV